MSALKILLAVVLLYFSLIELLCAQGLPEELCRPMCDTSCAFDGIYQYCRCDPLCEVYGDCCLDRGSCSTSALEVEDHKLPHFQCHRPVPLPPTLKEGEYPRIDPDCHFWYWMVLDCPQNWLNEGDRALRQSIQDLCISNAVDLPVSDKATGFDYRNEHCALCNGVKREDMLHWGYNYNCRIVLSEIAQNNSNFVLTQYDIDDFCDFLNFTRPNFTVAEAGIDSPIRYCYPTQPLTCLNQTALGARTGVLRSNDEYNSLKTNCERGSLQMLVGTQATFDNETLPYKNRDCAICNGYSDSEFGCFYPGFEGKGGVGIVFSLFLDIHQDGQLLISSEVLSTETDFLCLRNEVYDPFLKDCRSTIQLDCLNRSENMFLVLDEIECETITCNGSLIILDNSSVFLYDDNNRVIYGGDLFDIEFNTTVTDGEPVICVDLSRNGTRFTNSTIFTYDYPIGYFILTYVGCSLSVIGCLLVLITYTIFKQLRTLPSKLLMNLAFAILVTNLLIILGGPITSAFPENEDLCVSTAILLHFFSLSQFSWMCVMSTEVAHSFYNAHKMKPKDQISKNSNKLLVSYFVTGWSIPLVITVVTIIVNYSTDNLVLYGVTEDGTVGSCWINHFESMILAFILPVVISLTFNAIAFIIVCIFLIQGHCAQKKLKNKKSPYFRASVAIFSVSGLTWTFGFVALLSRSLWAWYPFIILNSIQGLLIFFAFIFTKKVGKLYLSLGWNVLPFFFHRR